MMRGASGCHFGSSGCLWGPPGVIFGSLGGSGGASGGLWLPFWGLRGLLGQFSLFGDLSALSAPGEASVSPQRGDVFRSLRFWTNFTFSGNWPPLRRKQAYGRRGAAFLNGRTNFLWFEFSADFCAIFWAWKKYAYGRRGGHIFTADRTGPSGRKRKLRAFFVANERFACTAARFSQKQ